MDAPFGAKINTALSITKPVTYYLPFFDEYLKEVEEIIKPEKLVVSWYHDYFASGISIEAGIKAVKLFAEKFDVYNKDFYYIGALKINGKIASYDNIDKYFANIHDKLEKSLLRKYKNQSERTDQSRIFASKNICVYVKSPLYRKGKAIVLFSVAGEPVDLF